MTRPFQLLRIDHIVLRVKGLDASVAFYGAEGNGLSLYVKDLDGNALELKGASDP